MTSGPDFASAPEPHRESLPDNVARLPLAGNAVNRFAAQIERLAETKEASASDLLRDMRLPDPPKSALIEALRRSHYLVEDEELHHPYFAEYVSVGHAIRCPGTTDVVYLVHIPAQILDVSKTEYLAAVNFLERLFPADSAVTVLSMDLLDPAGVYIKMLEQWREIKACFVSWRRITEFADRSYQAGSLIEDLKIEIAPIAAAAGAGSGDGGDSIESHQDEIAEILERVSSTVPNSKTYLSGLITRLNLPTPFKTQVAGIESQDPRSAAPSLVTFAMGRNFKPGRTVIGVLMAELGEDIGPPDQDRLLELIEQYGLLPEDEIRNRRQGK